MEEEILPDLSFVMNIKINYKKLERLASLMCIPLELNIWKRIIVIKRINSCQVHEEQDNPNNGKIIEFLFVFTTSAPSYNTDI